ncbi:NAD(P)-dependent oxidoreductase [Leptospira weilii]|uniref:NADP oxidoreductase coenzyme F420-dependent n=2 Tax=Leptospira weilii TaxID=28184 RepID=M6Q376_9LEPT|nr:NAD(P)-dependent oxidoreductase [Leptospira weilii]EMM70595.1 NADP oxidoreductase coenzyme F420-dependent [Leptospira weilii str. 2006001855]EMN89779.1 NADP oxidoreductase coenzyme F420-dependent [Leptospira weilii str. UI 13098]MCL8265442.1 NAD(P)-dependent oxidoreductase [Leptospira weilii]OMI18318.1 3-hydroxyisobutyrate dehydrogenase [Leptospira weilii serovar Heyan]ULH30241.1 NAD(P)-dependent oxidoreductase [Leptospira weilii]
MKKHTISIIGTGIMGRGIACNLAKADQTLRLYARNKFKIADLISDNVQIFDSPMEAAKNADLVVLCLTEDTVVEKEAITSGLLETKPPIILDCGTTSLSMTFRLAELCSAKQIRFYDSPMTGSKNAARDGQILFMVGAEKKEIADIQFFFELCGKNTEYCGALGSGQKAKFALNMIQAGIFQIYMEGFELAKNSGLEPETLKNILLESAAKSGIAEFKFPFVFSGNYETHFSLKNMRKDVYHAINLAKKNKTNLPLCQNLPAIYDAGMNAGFGENDFCSLNEVTAKIRPPKSENP